LTNFGENKAKSLENNDIKVDYAVMLGDIAKSLAMIADKLCCEVEDGSNN
jgi:hypothetical protein